MGFVVEVVRQGEQRPWRVLYGSGKVSRYALAAMHTLTEAFVDGMRNDGRAERRREEKTARSLKLEPEVGIVCSHAAGSGHVNFNWDDSKKNRTAPRDPRPPTPPRGHLSTPAPPTPKGLPPTPRGLSSIPAPPTPKGDPRTSRGLSSIPAPPTPQGHPPTQRGPPSTPAPPTPRTRFRCPSKVETELGQEKVQGFGAAENERPTKYCYSEEPTAYDAPSGNPGTRNPMWKSVNMA